MRVVVGCFTITATYLLIAILGLIPVNNHFVEADPAAPNSVEIFVRSSGVHSDVIMPIQSSVVDWSEHFPGSDFKTKSKLLRHVAVGWGDRGFYLETPTWDDLTFGTTAKAILWPSESVMHVTMTRPKESDSCRAVTISEQQYRELANFVLASFRLSKTKQGEGGLQMPIPIEQTYSYSWNDRFYEANGSYHAFNTCNCWVGRALRRTGVKTAWFTPLPRSVLVHWPRHGTQSPGWHWIVPPLAWLPRRQKK